MRRLVQARPGDVEIDAWPQRVEHPVAMQPRPRRQREEFHQRGGMPALPSTGRKRLAVDADGEAAQKVDLDPHRQMLTVSEDLVSFGWPPRPRFPMILL